MRCGCAPSLCQKVFVLSSRICSTPLPVLAELSVHTASSPIYLRVALAVGVVVLWMKGCPSIIFKCYSSLKSRRGFLTEWKSMWPLLSKLPNSSANREQEGHPAPQRKEWTSDRNARPPLKTFRDRQQLDNGHSCRCCTHRSIRLLIFKGSHRWLVPIRRIAFSKPAA